MNSGDVLRVILMTFGLMFMASIPTVAVIIFLMKYFTRVGKNNREMIQKASEIKAKQQEAEANEYKKQQIVTCPFCGKQSRFVDGQCKYCGGGLKLNEREE